MSSKDWPWPQSYCICVDIWFPQVCSRNVECVEALGRTKWCSGPKTSRCYTFNIIPGENMKFPKYDNLMPNTWGMCTIKSNKFDTYSIALIHCSVFTDLPNKEVESVSISIPCLSACRALGGDWWSERGPSLCLHLGPTWRPCVDRWRTWERQGS